MWPAIGAAISGALGLFGGKKSNDYSEKLNAQNLAAQKEFAQQGVRWRVEDAKAAGLHPLYALGAQLPSFSPSFSMDAMGPALASAGQDVGRAVGAIQTKAERAATQLQLELLKKQVDETDARIGLLNSEAARNRQLIGPQTFPYVGGGDGISSSAANDVIPEALLPFHNQGYVTSQAAPTMTTKVGDPTVTAGRTPMWSLYDVADGMQMYLPSTSGGGASEALESMSESLPLLAWVYMENTQRFGQQWGKNFLNRYFGNEASEVKSKIDSTLNVLKELGLWSGILTRDDFRTGEGF